MLTKFEDLSNEILYEIFEFLSFNDTYESFVNLNQRLNNVVINSSLPLHVDFSLRSKSTFEFYYQDILRSFEHRMESLHISNMFIFYRIFSLSSPLLKFPCLKHLSLTISHGISLRAILEQLNWLTQLLSLTITAQDRKHGFLDYISSQSPLTRNYYQFKSLQSLVLNCPFYWFELNALPSYFPELRYLSLQNLQRHTQERTDSPSSAFKYLKYLIINVNNLAFYQFQLMMRNIFNQIHTLSITINGGIEYLYANQWKQLITTHMSHLRVLNIYILYVLHQHSLPGNSKALFEAFHDAFWIERKWFFNYYIDKDKTEKRVVLYSTNPYRGKHFTLNKSNEERSSQTFEKILMNSVRCLDIDDRNAMLTCQYYFPNVNELKISNYKLENNEHFHLIDFNKILSLYCLTKLDIGNIYCSFFDIIELLFNAPNIHRLIINFDTNGDDLQLFQQNKTFPIVAQINQVQYLTINQNMTLTIIQFLLTFFLQIHHLEMHGHTEHLKDIVRFLLAKNNCNHRYLSSLILYNTDDITGRLAQFENLATNSLAYLEYEIGKNMFLWW